MPETMPTIRDVAEKAGVAPSTVSLVLNGRRWVSEEVRTTVTQAVDALGYKPRKKGRPKQAGRSNSARTRSLKKQVTLVFPHSLTDLHNNYLYLSIMHGLEKACRNSGFNLILQSAREPDSLAAPSMASRTDGVIFMGESSPAQFGELLNLLPFVRVMGLPIDDEPWDHVTYNNCSISRIAARYLVERGHKHVVFVASNPRYKPDMPSQFRITPFVRLSLERQRVFVQEIEARGATCTVTSAWPEEPYNYCPETFVPVVQQIKDMSPRPTGIFMPQDVLSERLYNAMDLIGLKLGREFDCISCDHDLWALADLDPKPATIDLQAEVIGQLAFNRILERLAQPSATRVVVTVEPKLVRSEDVKPVMANSR